MKFEHLVAKLIAERLVTSASVKPCSPAEVAELTGRWGISDGHREFFRVCGHGIGGLIEPHLFLPEYVVCPALLAEWGGEDDGLPPPARDGVPLLVARGELVAWYESPANDAVHTYVEYSPASVSTGLDVVDYLCCYLGSELGLVARLGEDRFRSTFSIDHLPPNPYG